MPSSDVVPWRIKTIPGMNTKMENFELQDKWVEKAQNCRFEEEIGAVDKRKPISYYNAGANKIGTDPIVSLHRYYASSGVVKFIAVAGTGVYVGDDSTGACTLIRTLTATGKRCSFITYNDLAMGFNGYDKPFVSDGSDITWELSSCKAEEGAGTGITKTGISYTVTYDADATVQGAVSNTIASVTNKSIELTNIPLGPVGTVNRKIYRKDSGTSGGYKLITTIANNVDTTYTDTTADASGGDALPAVTDEVPVGNIPVMYRERLYLAGDPNNQNAVYYSYPYLPHILLQTTEPDFMLVSPDDGDEITGLGVVAGILACVKKNNLRKLYVVGPESSWYAEDPLLHVGSPAPWSVVSTSGGLVFLGWNHWYLFDGASVTPIIDEFDTADILPARYSETVAFFHEDHILAAYTDATAANQYHDRIMRYNIKRQKLSYDTINANCFAAKRGGDETGELYYGSSIEGFIFKASNEDLSYRLNSKTMALAGTSNNTFVGGTQAQPYIEIGSTQTASAIPENVCMFWDSSDDPDSRWTEITAYDGKYIRVGDTAGVTGVIGGATKLDQSGTGTTINYINYRLFYRNATGAPIYEFPVGAIIFWDQAYTPVGYVSVATDQYIKIDSTDPGGTGTDMAWWDTGTSVLTLDAYLKIHCIKRIGETDTWDGLLYYCYALGNDVVNTNGWSDASATYDQLFISPSIQALATVSGGDTTYGVSLLTRDITTHTYTGGTGAYSIDGNWDNPQYVGNGSSGSGYTESVVISEHEFDEARHINLVKFKAQASGSDSAGGAAAGYLIQYQIDGSGTWTTFVGGSASSSCGSGTCSVGSHSEIYTLTVDISNVKKVKAYVYGNGYGDNSGNNAFLYEFEVYGDTVEYVELPIAKKILGKMKDYNAALDSKETAGDWTSPSVQLTNESLGKLYWNEVIASGDNIEVYFRSGVDQATCEAAAWSSAITNPNGMPLSDYISAAAWIQYKIEFTAVDSTVTNPQVYFADGFVLKFFYSQAATYAEDSVEFIYSLGYRNFDQPMMDKYHKKIGTVHSGTEGSFDVQWETENASDDFTISLPTNPERWSSFYQDTAMGEKLNITIYKNDLYDFRLKEINGFYSSEPILL
jgi:hypothetical protein